MSAQKHIVGEQSKPRISKYEFFQETQKYILYLCIFFNDRVFNAFFYIFRDILKTVLIGNNNLY